MSKRILIMFFLICLFSCNLYGCSSSDSKSEEVRKQQAVIDDLNDRLDEAKDTEALLRVQIEQLRSNSTDTQKKAEVYEIEHKYFPYVSNKALSFVRAQNKGDKKAIEEMLSNNLSISSENGVIKISNTSGDSSVVIYDEKDQLEFVDMVIQGYNYNTKDGLYRLYIKQFYSKADEQDYKILLLNLAFAKVHEMMKIVDIELDM